MGHSPRILSDDVVYHGRHAKSKGGTGCKCNCQNTTTDICQQGFHLEGSK